MRYKMHQCTFQFFLYIMKVNMCLHYHIMMTIPRSQCQKMLSANALHRHLTPSVLTPQFITMVHAALIKFIILFDAWGDSRSVKKGVRKSSCQTATYRWFCLNRAHFHWNFILGTENFFYLIRIFTKTNFVLSRQVWIETKKEKNRGLFFFYIIQVFLSYPSSL